MFYSLLSFAVEMKSLPSFFISKSDFQKTRFKSVFDSEGWKGEGMQDQEPLVIGEEDYTRTIYTVTLSRKLYDVLKKLTIESGNPYVGNTIVQLLEENPRVKKELEE